MDSKTFVDEHINELYHHGIKDQKWYNRRFQYSDGSLTPLGRIRYGVGNSRKASNKNADRVANVVRGTSSKDISNPSIAAKGKEFVRKKVFPTTAEKTEKIKNKQAKMEEKLAKQQAANDLQQKKVDLKNLKAEERRLKKERKQSIGDLVKDKEREQRKKIGKETLSDKIDRYNKMTDQDIRNQIDRLKNQITLQELEKRSKQSIGRRFVEDTAKNVAKEALLVGFKSLATNAGKNSAQSFSKNVIDPLFDPKARKEYEENKKALSDYRKQEQKKAAAESKREAQEAKINKMAEQNARTRKRESERLEQIKSSNTKDSKRLSEKLDQYRKEIDQNKQYINQVMDAMKQDEARYKQAASDINKNRNTNVRTITYSEYKDILESLNNRKQLPETKQLALPEKSSASKSSK